MLADRIKGAIAAVIAVALAYALLWLAFVGPLYFRLLVIDRG